MADIDKSEGQKEYPFDPIQELERISTDEYLVEMNAKADAVEAYLNTHDVGRQERAKLIEELDKDWIHMNQKVPVWGVVYTPSDMVAPDVVTYDTENAKGMTLASTGFMPLPFATILGDETVIDIKIAYSFLGKDMHVGMLRDGFAGKFPDSGPSMAMKRFEYHYPDAAAMINELADTTDSHPSATPIFNFARYEVQADTHTPDGKEYINDLQVYLTEKMNFDTKLPYLIKCELEEPGERSDSSVMQIIASPVKISMVSTEAPYAVGSLRHIPCVDLTVHDADYSKPDSFLRVPLRSLIRFDSIRRTNEG